MTDQLVDSVSYSGFKVWRGDYYLVKNCRSKPVKGTSVEVKSKKKGIKK